MENFDRPDRVCWEQLRVRFDDYPDKDAAQLAMREGANESSWERSLPKWLATSRRGWRWMTADNENGPIEAR